ncbi:hypothetical protein D3C85_1512050 [compost metagenome]
MFFVHVIGRPKAGFGLEVIDIRRVAFDVKDIDLAFAFQAQLFSRDVHHQPEPFVIIRMAEDCITAVLFEGVIGLGVVLLFGVVKDFGTFDHDRSPEV